MNRLKRLSLGMLLLLGLAGAGWLLSGVLVGSVGAQSRSTIPSYWTRSGTTISPVISTDTVAIYDIDLTDPLDLADGGTNKALTAANGGIIYSDTNSFEVLTPTATAGQMLRSGSSAAPSWSTATYPSTVAQGDILYAGTANTLSGLTKGNAGQIMTGTGTIPAWTTATYPSTTTANQILYSSGANVVAGLTTGNNSVLITSGAGVPSISATLPSAVQGNITAVGTIASGTWQGTDIDWARVNKTGSSLADLATRAVANLSDGTNVALLNAANTFTNAPQTISTTAPSLALTDTTATAKSLTIAVDANVADLRESAGATGSLLALDLANNRVGIGTNAPGLTFEVNGWNAKFTPAVATFYFYVGGALTIADDGSYGLIKTEGTRDLHLYNTQSEGITIENATAYIGLKTTNPEGNIHIATENTHGGYLQRTYAATSGTLTGATDTIELNIPTGWVVRGCQLHVKTTVVDDAGNDTWSAELNDGAQEEAIVVGAGAAQNTNVNHFAHADAGYGGTLTDAETDILLTPNGGNFTQGEIEAHCLCFGFDPWDNE